MTPLETLQRSAQVERMLASHDMAERMFVRVEEMLTAYDLASVRGFVQQLHAEARATNQVVERHAFVELLDALDHMNLTPSEEDTSISA